MGRASLAGPRRRASHGPRAPGVRGDRSLQKGNVGITASFGHSSTIPRSPHATERWIPAPVAAPRLEALPTTQVPRELVADRPAGQVSRMVAIAQVLATWRAAERTLAALPDADPQTWRAEAAVAAARADYHRLFAEHRGRQTGDGYPLAPGIGRTR